jgi:hypothetical protein
MENKLDWFPIDLRIFPIDFSLPRLASPWVKIAIFSELILGAISVFGAVSLVILSLIY